MMDKIEGEVLSYKEIAMHLEIYRYTACTGCSINIVFFPRILESLPPLSLASTLLAISW